MIPGILVGLAAGAVQLILLRKIPANLTSENILAAGGQLMLQMMLFVAVVLLGFFLWRNALIWSVTAMVAVMVIGTFAIFGIQMIRDKKHPDDQDHTKQ